MRKRQLALFGLSVLLVLSLCTSITVRAESLRARVIETQQKREKSSLIASPAFNNMFNTPTLRREPVDYGSEFIDDVTFTDKNGQPITAIKNNSVVVVTYEWSIPNNIDVFEGDMMVIDLPKELNIDRVASFEVLDGQTNEVVGYAKLNKARGKVEVTFTDYVEGKINIGGIIRFNVVFEVVSSEEDRVVQVEFPTKGGISKVGVTVPGEIKGPEPEEKPPAPNQWDIYKIGYQDSNVENEFWWRIRVNGKQQTYKHATLEDNIHDGHELLLDSIVIEKGLWHDDSDFEFQADVTQQFYDENRIYKDTQYFKIDFGDMDKDGYHVKYRTKVSDYITNSDGIVFSNDVVFKADMITPITDKDSVVHVTGSGSAQGVDSAHDVKVIKKEQDSDKLLSGAVFSLYSNGEEQRKNLRTNDKGEFEIKQLPLGQYELRETKAPTGYKLADKPIAFELVKENGQIIMNKNKTGQLEVIDNTGDSNEKVLELSTNSDSTQPLTLQVRDVESEPAVIEIFNERNEWTVHFETNGGSEIEDQQVIDGKRVDKPVDPTKADVEFGDWYMDEALTKLYNFRTPIHEDKTLYAQWLDMDSTPRINLRVKHNQLVIFYRNLDELVLEINGEEYKRLSVDQTLNDDQVTIPLKVDSNRTKVVVKGKVAGKTVVSASLNGSK